jgi:RHH-type proline utilization regulon transcriptional repressor/proline dehydrogenase/delta 1-pyrroline-5-carboxylate dehydrogenase
MDPLERSIRRIGLELFAAQARHQPWPLSRAWLHDRGMALSLADPALQLALFRFIDALPSARDGATAARLLREHLQPVAGRLPEPARRALAALPAAPAEWVGALAALGARELAARFLLGARIPAIVRHLDRLHRRGLCFTVDRLGEAVLTEAEADAYLASYLELLPALAEATAAWPAQPGVPAVNLSIKLSALTSRFEAADPAGTCARVGARLRPLLRAARAAGALVNLDMEHHAYRDTTLHILRTLGGEDEFRAWDGLGIAIQAYLRGCGDDLAMLAAWARARGAPLWVRLVKGAYWDHETALADSRGWDCPVHRDKGATDAAYERHTRFLLENRRWLRPAFASHNVRSLAHAIALRDQLGIPAHEVEFQLLHGMADPLKAALAGRGERVRVYCPVGELLPGVAYLVRRLLENTSNQGFVRASSLENRPPAELLAAPAPADPPAKEPSMFNNHPCADFSCEDQRRAMAEALAALRPLVCGDGAAARWLVSEDPCRRGCEVGRAPASSAAQARTAVDRAAAALPGWEAAGWEARIACLERLAARLAEDRWRLAALLVREVAKSWREADAEVCELIDFCRYYALQARRLAAGAAVDAPGETNDTVYGPRGVAVVIAPWNFPLAILGGMAVAALVAGNPVVLKPAEQAPVVAWALHRHLLAAGIPAEAVQYLSGDGEEVGPALADHPATALIAFTGSRAVGLGLNRRAAEALDQRRQVVRVLAEMGGKNAIIVDASADLDEAVAGVLASAFGYQGQKCSACSRAIVHRDRYRDFAARLAEAVRALEPGPADHPGHLFGPVIDDQARLRLERQCAELDARHRCLVRGDIGDWAGQGAWVAPRLYDEVNPGSWLAQEELFGPVLALIPADSLEQALAIANGTRYALTGGCFARSPAALAQVRAGFAVGNLYLNRGITGALVHRQPFGGFRLSGIGSKAGGPDYLQQFCLPRVITENTLRHGMVGRRDGRPGMAQ